jgi:serine/threonine protein kinase
MRAQVMTDVLHALRYLHRRGVVHNDVKPENIVVGENGSAKLGDFGASQMFDGAEAAACTMLRSPGTPGFTAPECLTDDAYDGRAADMWALGVTLYMLLVGSSPYQV